MDLTEKSNFNINLRRIQLFGWWKIDSASFSMKFAYGVYKSFALTWLHVFSILQLMDLYEAVTDLEKVSTNLCGTFVSVVSTVKTVVVLAKAGSVEDLYLGLINNFDMDHIGKDEEDKRILTEASVEILNLTKMFFTLVIPTIFGWSLMPFIDDNENTKHPLRLWMPFDSDASPNYEMVYAYEVIGLWVFAVNILSQDLIFFGFVIHICSHYDILDKNLRKLNKFYDEESAMYSEKALVAEIKKSVAHHQHILKKIKQVQWIYKEILFTHFCGSLPLLCVIGFNIISAFKTKGISTHMLSQVGYVGSTLFDIFFFCIFGERVKQKGLKIAETLYDGLWYKVGSSPRKFLVIIMAMAQNSPGFSAGHVLPINLGSFLQMLRNAYNILAVMNQMSH